MDKEPRLLVWNYTAREQAALDALLKEIGAPRAVPVPPSQAGLTLREIIDEKVGSDADHASDEKAILFYNIPQKGVFFLIETFKRNNLPRPIYAVVTEHSINWSLTTLLEHLAEEKTRMEKAGK